LVKVSLTEPINPAIDPQVLPRAADIARKAIKNIPDGFPNVEDAVNDYKNSIHYITELVQKEYSNMFANEEDGPSSLGIQGGTTSVKSQNNTFHSPQ